MLPRHVVIKLPTRLAEQQVDVGVSSLLLVVVVGIGPGNVSRLGRRDLRSEPLQFLAQLELLGLLALDRLPLLNFAPQLLEFGLDDLHLAGLSGKPSLALDQYLATLFVASDKLSSLLHHLG